MESGYAALPAFVAVVEHGNFSAAAQKLNITKSAVSKRIVGLEDTLGVKLFTRTTRTMQLTEAGERLADYARNAIDLASEGFAAISDLQESPKGTLKISAPMTFSRLHLVPFLSEFFTRFPEIDVTLNMNDDLISLAEGGFDIGIRIGKLQDSSLIAKRMVDCPSVLCASPRYLEKIGVPEDPQALETHNCLYYSLFQAGVEWTFTKHRQTYKVRPRGNFVVNNSDAIAQALLDGIGIAQMPTFIVAPYLQSGELVPILNSYALPKHAVYAMYPERKHLPQKVRVFIEFLTEKWGENTAYWDVA